MAFKLSEKHLITAWYFLWQRDFDLAKVLWVKLENLGKIFMENPGIDPGTSHMLSERSTTWANSPLYLQIGL